MRQPGQPMLWEVVLPGFIGDGQHDDLIKWGTAFDEDDVRRMFPGAGVAELPEAHREYIEQFTEFTIGRKPEPPDEDEVVMSSGTPLVQRQEACIAQLMPLYMKWTERNAGKPRDRWAGFGMDLNGLRSRILRKHREELQRVGFSKAEVNQSAQDCRDMAQLRTLAED